MLSDKKPYDLILFGVTGFTGKLAVEYLLVNYSSSSSLKWAACARNPSKAQTVLDDIVATCNAKAVAAAEALASDLPPTLVAPPLLTADLVCTTAEQEQALKQIVLQTKVVLTCSGPFEKYGTTLVKLCAEHGVHYADITGETDFVRSTIQNWDAVARKNGAALVHHCGNDCVPQDLTVFEMNEYAKQQGGELVSVHTFGEFSAGSTYSGGTLATAQYQLGKDRKSQSKPDFDPLLTTPEGTKSEFITKNVSPREVVTDPDLERKVGPWIMAPVMANCVRRSNTLLQYSKKLNYGDAIVKDTSLTGWAKSVGNDSLLALSLKAPSLFARFLPQAGEGPPRSVMEEGYLILHGRGVMKKKKEGEIREGDEKFTTVKLVSTFRFNKDISYLYTAALLCEAGMLLLSEQAIKMQGVLTPASAFGSDYTKRITEKLDVSWELTEGLDL